MVYPSPRERLVKAAATWAFSTVMEASAKAGRISHAAFPSTVNTSDTAGDPFTIKIQNFGPGNIELELMNHRMVLLGPAFQTFDQVIKQVFGKEEIRYSGDDLGPIHAFKSVAVLRNAYAHDAFDPIWTISNEKLKGDFTIPSIGWAFNTSSLVNGDPVLRSDYGGVFKIARLFDYLIGLVSLKTEGAVNPDAPWFPGYVCNEDGIFLGFKRL